LDHRRICGPSLTETSLCGAYLCYLSDGRVVCCVAGCSRVFFDGLRFGLVLVGLVGRSGKARQRRPLRRLDRSDAIWRNRSPRLWGIRALVVFENTQCDSTQSCRTGFVFELWEYRGIFRCTKSEKNVIGFGLV